METMTDSLFACYIWTHSDCTPLALSTNSSSCPRFIVGKLLEAGNSEKSSFPKVPTPEGDLGVQSRIPPIVKTPHH